MDPALRSNMRRVGIFWDRYQANMDYKLFTVCLKLKRAKLIQDVFVDRYHVTNVLVEGKVGAIPIFHISDLICVFSANQLGAVNPIVQEIFPESENDHVLAVETGGVRASRSQSASTAATPSGSGSKSVKTPVTSSGSTSTTPAGASEPAFSTAEASVSPRSDLSE